LKRHTDLTPLIEEHALEVTMNTFPSWTDSVLFVGGQTTPMEGPTYPCTPTTERYFTDSIFDDTFE